MSDFSSFIQSNPFPNPVDLNSLITKYIKPIPGVKSVYSLSNPSEDYVVIVDYVQKDLQFKIYNAEMEIMKLLKKPIVFGLNTSVEYYDNAIEIK